MVRFRHRPPLSQNLGAGPRFGYFSDLPHSPHFSGGLASIPASVVAGLPRGTAIGAFIDACNDRCQLFAWTKDAGELLAKVRPSKN